MSLTRREFLARSAAGGVTLGAASACFPEILARTARAAAQAALAGHADTAGRILVLVQLTGGNDGLSTVTPYRDEHYRRLRPTLALGRDEVLKLNDEVGLCPQLRPMKGLFDEGWLTVVQGVGYPNPNRSHFESMDIWHCCDPTLKERGTGWLGRALDGDAALLALHIDDAALPLALRGTRADVPSVGTIEDFRLAANGDARVRRALGALLESGKGVAGRGAAADDAEYIRRTAVSACENARRLEALPHGADEGYPGYGLARRLREISQLIAAEYGPRIFYTSLGGFDTHARQKTVHPALMDELGQSVAAFFADLKSKGLAERVVLLTFSEFGRRAEENASLGTDHGAAAPVFVAGPGVKGGVVGPAPDLSRLVEGDVPHAIDFRCVYAGLLERWLGIRPGPIVGAEFEALGVVG